MMNKNNPASLVVFFGNSITLNRRKTVVNKVFKQRYEKQKDNHMGLKLFADWQERIDCWFHSKSKIVINMKQ